MEIKFCARSGCYEPAVGTGIRPVTHCRPHYLDEIAAEIVRAEVIGDVRVTDVRTGASVGRGGIVELDPVETQVAQLVYCRHIRVLPREGQSPGGVVPGESEQTLAAGEHVIPAGQSSKRSRPARDQDEG